MDYSEVLVGKASMERFIIHTNIVKDEEASIGLLLIGWATFMCKYFSWDRHRRFLSPSKISNNTNEATMGLQSLPTRVSLVFV